MCIDAIVGCTGQTHCRIEWDGVESALSAVIVKDLNSSNGTYVSISDEHRLVLRLCSPQINGRKIRKGESALLQDWNQISFGPLVDDPDERPKDDYRTPLRPRFPVLLRAHEYSLPGFVFRHMASTQRGSDEGLYEMYDVQFVLGRGAYATVVKALHRKEGTWYAVKMFSGDKLRRILDNTVSRGHDRGETTSHLQKEVQILERLEHPNICKLKEAFYEGFSVSKSELPSLNDQSLLTLTDRRGDRARSWRGPHDVPH